MNVFENIPYQDDKMGNRKLVDEDHLLVMQIALRPGQLVPQHNANSNVRLLVLNGDLQVSLDGIAASATKGDLVPVNYKTPMSIKNVGAEDATFLVFKTPNPSLVDRFSEMVKENR